jgi:hypothetical protein
LKRLLKIFRHIMMSSAEDSFTEKVDLSGPEPFHNGGYLIFQKNPKQRTLYVQGILKNLQAID